MITRILQLVKRLMNSWTKATSVQEWPANVLVVGPSQPVDGDSVACTKALIAFLRKQGITAFTLPTLAMYEQLEWILAPGDYHPAALVGTTERFTTDNLQSCYDAMIAVWRPDLIIQVDGPRHQLGFDPRGVKVFVIDHHVDHGTRDDADAYIQPASSAGCLLIERFGVYEPILAISILTDSYWLRQNLPAQAACCLAKLVERGGLTDALLIELQRKLFVRKDVHILEAIHNAEVRFGDNNVFLVLKDANPEIHRGVMAELNYFRAQNVCVVRGDGYVSFKTADPTVDLRPLAHRWLPGGGHPNMAAGHVNIHSNAELEKLHDDFVATVTASRSPQPA